MNKDNLSIKIDNTSDSEVEVSGELTNEAFMEYWSETVAELAKNVSIPGFREGKAPEKMIVEKIGPDNILREMAQKAMQDVYPLLIKENKIDAIGRPEISITQLEKDKPLGFSIKTAVIPNFELPDYQNIAQEALKQEFKPKTVSEEDIKAVLTELKKRLKAKDQAEQGTTGEESSEQESPETEEDEITDEMAQSLGDFETVADLKAKIKENLEAEKQKEAEDKKRQALIEAIIKETEITIPDILIESELDKMTGELRSQIESSGLKFEDYLSHLKKTQDELRQTWREDARKRVQAGLILQAIATKENITAEEEELAETMNNLAPNAESLEDAQKTRLRSYAENLITNNKVFELLKESR